MVARAGDQGLVHGRTSLVPHNNDPSRLPATIPVKRPDSDAGNGDNMANWVVHNAKRVFANAYFYKYLEHAEGAILSLRGTALSRKFSIEEVTARRGWWKQGKVTDQTGTVLPAHLRF
jgi:hypothetical protein